MVELARYIEHTALSPVLTINDIDRVVTEARQYNFLGVCVPPFWVSRAKREIGNDPITLVTVAGFPLGYNMTETKLDDIRRGIDQGATEVDVVWNLTSFRTGIPWTKIEIAKCAKACHHHSALLKVIIETCYLSDEEIKQACILCADAGADFVKTSTGFGTAGATVEHVKLMRSVLPSSVGVKASGGIKTHSQAIALIEAGADRIGTSSAVSMMMEKS
ncbi:MAG: deoxyribose-phosphate aldolase [Cyclobacteriaceae bacterium]|nr:deoxyribose-phosphate aldolase [Cyclobacteriaceae bacterium]